MHINPYSNIQITLNQVQPGGLMLLQVTGGFEIERLRGMIDSRAVPQNRNWEVFAFRSPGPLSGAGTAAAAALS